MEAEFQRCLVHQVRNTLKYAADKDRKPFAADLKKIYHAPTEETALESLEQVTEKRSPKYPNSMKSRSRNWDAIPPVFKFSAEVRKVIYTTNAIESRNSTGSEAEPPEERISQRYSTVESAVSGCVRGGEEMDDADPELGAGPWGIEYHV